MDLWIYIVFVLIIFGLIYFLAFRSTPHREASKNEEPKIVFSSGKWEKIFLIKSILEAHEIPFSTRNEFTQNLLGGTNLFGGYNYAIGPVEIIVPEENREEALALIQAYISGEVEFDAADVQD